MRQNSILTCMSAIEPVVSPESSKGKNSKVGNAILLTIKRLMRLCVLTTIALILLLLPALFVKQPHLPQRQLSKELTKASRDLPSSQTKNTQLSRSKVDSSSKTDSQPAITEVSELYADQLEFSQQTSEASIGSAFSNEAVTADRAQLSFARLTNPIATNASNFQIGGITVRGPILSGRALARDSQGRLVRSLSQPNLLIAGRGFIPSTSLSSSVGGRSDGGVVDVRARSTTESIGPVPENDEDSRQQLIRETFGIFSFSTDQLGNGTITRTRGGTSEVVASRQMLSESSEQTVLTDRSALPTWNEFIGELFLIVVSPNLVGERTIEGFQLQKIDENNHLQLLAVRNGDVIRLVNGEPITNITIEALPDLLLDRKAEITVRRKEGRDSTTLITVD